MDRLEKGGSRVELSRYVSVDTFVMAQDLVMYNGTDHLTYVFHAFKNVRLCVYANPTDFFFGFSSTLSPLIFPFLSCFFSFASFINANLASRYLVSSQSDVDKTAYQSSIVQLLLFVPLFLFIFIRSSCRFFLFLLCWIIATSLIIKLGFHYRIFTPSDIRD